MKVRETIGTVEMYPLIPTLYINMYENLKPKKQVEELEEVIEVMEDKTIHLLKKEDQPVFFPELPELEGTEDIIPEDIKIIKVKDMPEPDKGGVKTISINPNYVVPNK